jgi:hypothetical protein
MSDRHPYDLATFHIFDHYGPNPDPGLNFTLALDQLCRYELMYCHVTLTTSAAIADRFVHVTLDALGAPMVDFFGSTPLTGGFTYILHFQRGPVQLINPVMALGHGNWSTGVGNIVSHPESINIRVTNIQAADQLSAIYFGLRKWYDPQTPIL